MESKYNTVASKYDAHYQNPFDIAEEEHIFKLIAPYLKGHICDVGCGTGLLLDLLARMHHPFESYTGFDISDEMVKIAKEKARRFEPCLSNDCIAAKIDGIFVQDAQQWVEQSCESPFYKTCFTYDTIVLLYGVSSYLDNFNRFLRNAWRSRLKPGGHIVTVHCSPRYADRKHYILSDTGKPPVTFQQPFSGAFEVVPVNTHMERLRELKLPKNAFSMLFKLDTLLFKNPYLWITIYKKN